MPSKPQAGFSPRLPPGKIGAGRRERRRSMTRPARGAADKGFLLHSSSPPPPVPTCFPAPGGFLHTTAPRKGGGQGVTPSPASPCNARASLLHVRGRRIMGVRGSAFPNRELAPVRSQEVGRPGLARRRLRVPAPGGSPEGTCPQGEGAVRNWMRRRRSLRAPGPDARFLAAMGGGAAEACAWQDLEASMASAGGTHRPGVSPSARLPGSRPCAPGPAGGRRRVKQGGASRTLRARRGLQRGRLGFRSGRGRRWRCRGRTARGQRPGVPAELALGVEPVVEPSGV